MHIQLKFRILISVMVMIWFSYGAIFMYQQCVILINYFPKVIGLSLENKYELIDGEYCRFIKFCSENIPKDEDVNFILAEAPEFGGDEWIEAEYYIQKAPYYLYPRKVFRIEQRHPTDYVIEYDSKIKKFSVKKQLAAK